MHHGGKERRDIRFPNRLRRRVRNFNNKWGDIVQLILSCFLVTMAFVLVVVALSVRSLSVANTQQSQDAKDSARDSAVQSKANCNRARLIGPYTLADYTKRHVLPPDVADVYRAAIPKKC